MSTLKIDQKTTRIDIVKVADGIEVKSYLQGWQEGQKADDVTWLSSSTLITSLLFECEQKGFTVEMADANTGRALRGQITRIDLLKTDKGWEVKKFPFGWTAKTKPLSTYVIPESEGITAIEWLKEHKWTVRNWPNGTRAWKGEMKPVRDAGAIRYMRNQQKNNSASGIADERKQYDLAYDF